LTKKQRFTSGLKIIHTDRHKIFWVIPTNMKRICPSVHFQLLNFIVGSFFKVLCVNFLCLPWSLSWK